MGGRTRYGRLKGLWATLPLTIVALIAPNGAAAITCPDGSLAAHYESPAGPEGTFCVEPILLADQTDQTTCGTTPCYRFRYRITSLFGESLSAVNLTIPAAKKFCSISILSPTERSVKIREYEPSTGFSLTDTNTDVITWDALKLDPSNKRDIDVYLTQTGAGPQVMELKTASGSQYVDIDGPICCSTTQIPTSIIFNPKAFNTENGPVFSLAYDSCTGEADTDDLVETFGYSELVNGAFVCSGASCGPKDWIKIKKLGPRSGAALYTQNIFTLKYASFFGFGNKIFRLDGGVGPAVFDDCTDEEAYEVVTFDNRIRVAFNSCLAPITVNSCTQTETGFDCGTAMSQERVFIAPGKPNGQPDTSQVFEVLAGPRDGAIIYANPSYYCTMYGIGCYR